MAQGVQKKTEYAGLQFLGVSAVKKLLGFEIREAPGEHARGKFRVLLSEEAPVVCERNVPVQLREEGNRAEALFCGYPQRTETMTEHGWRIAEIEAVSGTVLLDMEKRSRVFQDRRQTYLGIAGAVTAETGHSACILAGDDRETGGTLIQYGETDWKFLKRMASRMGLPLVPDTGYYYPRFYMGLPEGEKKELGEVLSCGICFDGRYYAVSGRCTVDRKDFICYDVVTGTRLSLGDRVTYEGRGKQLRLCPCNGKPDVLHAAGGDKGGAVSGKRERGAGRGVRLHPDERRFVRGNRQPGKERLLLGARQGNEPVSPEHGNGRRGSRKAYDGGRERNASGKQRESAPAGKRGNPPGEHDGNRRAWSVGHHGTLRGRNIEPLCERQCGHDGRSYGTGRQYIQKLCAVCRRPGGGEI